MFGALREDASEDVRGREVTALVAIGAEAVRHPATIPAHAVNARCEPLIGRRFFNYRRRARRALHSPISVFWRDS
jgi:hypothetical protein